MKILIGIARHALTFAGGAAVVSGDDITSTVGAIVTVAGVVGSVINKIKAARRDTK